MIVDSCVDRRSGRAVALDYFAALGIDPTYAVSLIVATHWHDDHIGGLEQLVERCENAAFFCSAAVTADEMFLLRGTARGLGTLSTSGVRTISEVMALLKTSGREMRRCLETALIWSTPHANVWSVAPSSEDFNRALVDIQAAIQAVEDGRRAAPGSNHASVALWVDISGTSAVLGGDVEAPASPVRGWRAILRNAEEGRPPGLLDASAVKIPHHGSDDAQLPAFYEALTADDWVGVVTPFRAGRKPRPSPADRERLMALGHRMFVTSDAPPGRVRHESAVERTLREVGVEIDARFPPHGQVRLTARTGDGGTGWDAEHWPPAIRLA